MHNVITDSFLFLPGVDVAYKLNYMQFAICMWVHM